MSVSAASSRSNSIEITNETTLTQLQALEFGDGSGASARRQKQNHQDDLGRSLNFLNLDRKSMTPSNRTVGGASARSRLMQNRIRRLKKSTPVTINERLYQSDSALFSSSAPHDKEDSHDTKRSDVWFKALYPKQGALEKLDEAEQEYDESQRSSSDHADFMSMSGTDMWLFENNQSAPGFLPGDGHRMKYSLTDAELDEEDNNGTGTGNSDDVDHSRR